MEGMEGKLGRGGGVKRESRSGRWEVEKGEKRKEDKIGTGREESIKRVKQEAERKGGV
jgi:hypothetical protein